MSEITKVVDLGAFRAKIKHGTHWDKKHCAHLHVTIDKDGGVIDCDDCKKPVSAFHLIVSWCSRWNEIAEAVKRQKVRSAAMAKTMRGYKVRLRALQALEKWWWRAKMLPCCPHCGRGLMPEDFADGATSSVGREYEIAQREKEPARQWAAKRKPINSPSVDIP